MIVQITISYAPLIGEAYNYINVARHNGSGSSIPAIKVWNYLYREVGPLKSSLKALLIHSCIPDWQSPF